MNVLVIYSSKTGFTKKYADQIVKETGATGLTIKEAKKKDETYFDSYGAIVFGGWIMAGNVADADWFLTKAKEWTGKKLILFGCGATEADSPEVATTMERAVPVELKAKVKAFYCPGGLDYSKLKFPARLLMKALASSLKNKKDATEEEKKKGERMAESFDISDLSYVQDMVNEIIQ